MKNNLFTKFREKEASIMMGGLDLTDTLNDLKGSIPDNAHRDEFEYEIIEEDNYPFKVGLDDGRDIEEIEKEEEEGKYGKSPVDKIHFMVDLEFLENLMDGSGHYLPNEEETVYYHFDNKLVISLSKCYGVKGYHWNFKIEVMDEKFRSINDGIEYICPETNITVSSWSCPEIISTDKNMEIYLRGEDRHLDCDRILFFATIKQLHQMFIALFNWSIQWEGWFK